MKPTVDDKRWISLEKAKPDDNIVVWTLSDGDNPKLASIEQMKRAGWLWRSLDDRTVMYCPPTHWMPIE